MNGFKILVMGKSGSGKTTSVFPSRELNIKGLNPKETFYVTVSGKTPVMRNWSKHYVKGQNFVMLDSLNGLLMLLSKIIKTKEANKLKNGEVDIKHIVIDDMQYLYTQSATKALDKASNRWDEYTNIGILSQKIMDAMRKCADIGLNVIELTHYTVQRAEIGLPEIVPATFSNMTNKNVTPKGWFDIIVISDIHIDGETGEVSYKFQLRPTSEIKDVKMPPYMFPGETYIPNDLGLIISEIENTM